MLADVHVANDTRWGWPHVGRRKTPLSGVSRSGSIAYNDGHNLWYSSADGARKVQLTAGGSEDASWQVPSQGRDGKTVVVHRDTFEGGAKRPVLYLYGADGRLVTANVMPVYSGAIGGAVYPIGLDMDWNSNAVAYGYQYCGFACQSLYRGYWRSPTTTAPTRPTRRAPRTRSTRPSTRPASCPRTPAATSSCSPTSPRRRSRARTRAG